MTVAGDKPRLYIFCSHYSHVPTAAGTPRYEKPEVWFGKAYRHGRFAYAPRPTPARDKPTRYRIPAVAGTTWLGGVTGTRGRHGNHLSRIGVRDMLSYQFGGLCYNFRPPRRD